MKYKVQSRQLRNHHVDEHYVFAQHKYAREFAVMFRNEVTFFSIDDKAKVDIGEPGKHLLYFCYSEQHPY